MTDELKKQSMYTLTLPEQGPAALSDDGIYDGFIELYIIPPGLDDYDRIMRRGTPSPESSLVNMANLVDGDQDVDNLAKELADSAQNAQIIQNFSRHGEPGVEHLLDKLDDTTDISDRAKAAIILTEIRSYPGTGQELRDRIKTELQAKLKENLLTAPEQAYVMRRLG